MFADSDRCIERGDAAAESNSPETALEWYLRATVLAPDDFEAWTSAGDLLMELGRPAEAAPCFKGAAEADPEDPDLLTRQARALSMCGAYEEAARCLERALTVAEEQGAGDEEVADVLTARGVAAFDLARTAEACKFYQRALRRMPRHDWAERNLRHAAARLCWERSTAAAAAAAGDDSSATTLAPYRTVALPPIEGFKEANPLWFGHLVHWLDTETCAELVAAAERHAAAVGGWVSTRHDEPYATYDFEVSEVPEVRDVVVPLIRATMLPTVASLFEGVGDSMCLRELFLVKYDAGADGKAELALHRDGYLLTFSVLLNDEFSGGGTRLETLGTNVCPERVGDAFLHSGRMLHGGAPITRGTRYILVGFVEVGSPAAATAPGSAEWVREHTEPPDEAGAVDYETLAREWAAVMATPGPRPTTTAASPQLEIDALRNVGAVLAAAQSAEKESGFVCDAATLALFSGADTEQMQRLIRRMGVCVVPRAVPADVTDTMRLRALAAVASRRHAFSDIAKSELRKDTPLEFEDDPAVRSWMDAVLSAVGPALCALLGPGAQLVELATLVSFSGAESQLGHADADMREPADIDGAARLVSLFCNLVDVAADQAALDVWPGTHTHFHFSERQDLVGKSLRMALPRGSVVAMDARTFHRGSANATSRPRPVAYMTFAEVGRRLTGPTFTIAPKYSERGITLGGMMMGEY